MNVALRTALALYPARYRRDRGAELAEVFADTTAGSGRLATAREALDLAAYGLRLRTGLTDIALPGRLLAAAAPLLTGALLGLAVLPGVGDWREYTLTRAARSGTDLPWPRLVENIAVLGLAVIPLLLVAAAALGAWRAVRLLGTVVALLGAVRIGHAALSLPPSGVWSGWFFAYETTALVPYLLGGLMLAVAPARPADAHGRTDRLLILAGAAAGFAVTRAQGGYDTRNLMDGWWPVALLLIPLLLVLFAARDRLLPAALGLALLPLTAGFSLFSLWEQLGGVWRAAPWALGTATVLLLGYRLLGSARPTRRQAASLMG
ncbi:hypothetical protein [Kitasatospora sp. CB02891]|uniref:hypothetical protein n=1 Tax=Kitasatospora sp. CB02891 TaxID=2020329 RepID=UPI000C270AF6|nr:hypothetical protein [Kitasatospora sp. CB02891]PJN24173.1 hypothetical protein CG736_20005 [Kitasatospora sp. CB02891]